jgi:hypothetical protein
MSVEHEIPVAEQRYGETRRYSIEFHYRIRYAYACLTTPADNESLHRHQIDAAIANTRFALEYLRKRNELWLDPETVTQENCGDMLHHAFETAFRPDDHVQEQQYWDFEVGSEEV